MLMLIVGKWYKHNSELSEREREIGSEEGSESVCSECVAIMRRPLGVFMVTREWLEPLETYIDLSHKLWHPVLEFFLHPRHHLLSSSSRQNIVNIVWKVSWSQMGDHAYSHPLNVMEAPSGRHLATGCTLQCFGDY